MKLSIIVPVFNMAADGKLEYCLESLVNQTIDDYEIIAVDDCSTDNSLEILRKYESKYPNDPYKIRQFSIFPKLDDGSFIPKESDGNFSEDWIAFGGRHGIYYPGWRD